MASTTLTWAFSGLATKTGTTQTELFNDLETLMNSKSGDATFFWQVASKNLAGNPFTLVLKPKSGAVGRILILYYGSVPGTNNAAIWPGYNPAGTCVYTAYFPDGNVDSPSNLTAASGTIMGNDTGVIPCSIQQTIASLYGASIQQFYFDSAEAFWWMCQNPSVATQFASGLGYILVDATDTAIAACARVGTPTSSLHNFGATTSVFPYLTSAVQGSTSGAGVKVNSPAANTDYFQAWVASGVWPTQPAGATDPLADTSVNKVWFVPMSLIGRAVKGGGFPYKFRQMGIGPGTTAAFQAYLAVGGAVAARQSNAQPSGATGYPWFLNFKI